MDPGGFAAALLSGMMVDEGELRADARVVETWVRGWTLARETSAPVPDSGGWRVDVGWPEQRARYVFPALGEGVRRLGETITEPYVFLKACAPADALRSLLPPRWEMQRPRFMMMRDDVDPSASIALLDGYALEIDADRPVPVARIVDSGGEVASIGRLAMVGAFGIYDRIETHPDHRRQGLARTVMHALQTLARSRGATRGVLVATAEGRALYESLGWRLHSLYSTAVIPPMSAGT